MNANDQPLLSMPAGGVRLIGLIMVVLEGTLLVMAIAFALFIPDGGVLSGAFIALTALSSLAIVWAIVPRRYEVWRDRLRLVFPWWRWDIGFESIEAAEVSLWWQSYAFYGVRFATAPNQSIVIRRRNARMLGRPNLVISPADRAAFLPVLRDALERYRGGDLTP